MLPILTQEEDCQNCYACVRACPVKAIKKTKETEGTSIAEEMCVGCGHCVPACSRDLYRLKNQLPTVMAWLKEGEQVVVSLGHAAPAAFPDWEMPRLLQALLQLGFKAVELDFSAISHMHEAYAQLQERKPEHTMISSFCPGVRELFRRYYPHLRHLLAPLPPPTWEHSQSLRKKYGKKVRVLYIGACAARFNQFEEEGIDANITFDQLKEILSFPQTDPGLSPPVPLEPFFSPKWTGPQGVYLVEGLDNLVGLLESYQKEKLRPGLVYAYTCPKGCISGPGLSSSLSPFKREELVKDFHAANSFTGVQPSQYLFSEKVDLSPAPVKLRKPSREEIKIHLSRSRKFLPEDELNCKACGYSSCREKATAIARDMAEPEMCFPFLVNRQEELTNDLDRAFAFMLPDSHLGSLRAVPEYQDRYDRQTGLLTITGIIEEGLYWHIINALRIASDLYNIGAFKEAGVDRELIVEAILFHDLGKRQPQLQVGDQIDPRQCFEPGKKHAFRSAALAKKRYRKGDDVIKLIAFHHHREEELPPGFPDRLLPALRLIKLIDGLSAGITRRGNTCHFSLEGSNLTIKEISIHPSYNQTQTIDLNSWSLPVAT